MAVYRFSASIIGRSSGRSATAAAAYRAGAEIEDERTGLTHDYTRRDGVTHSEILAPEKTPEWMYDRQQLWNAVEKAEKRKDAQLAREILFSLPHELSADERRELIRDFIRGEFVDRGMIADLNIHLPDKDGDNRNHHAHVMLTMRELAGEGFASKKNRDWNKSELLENWRERWAEHQNERFAQLGYDLKVDHRSLEAQGIDREPEPKLGPHNSQKERDGLSNAKIEAWRQARAEREELHRINSEIRRFETWAEAKKADLAREKFDAMRAMEVAHDSSRAEVQDMLDNFYGDGQEKAKAALRAVQERQEAAEKAGITKPVRKWWYHVTGRQERDTALAVESRAELDDINNKMTAHMAKLDQEQTQQQEGVQAQFHRRQEAQASAIERTRQDREKKWWQSLPEREVDESTTSGKWWRAQHEPEQSQDAAPEAQQNIEQDRGHEPER